MTKALTPVLACLVILYSCSAKKNITATPVNAYEVSYNNGKILKGIVKRSDLEGDTAFSWFKRNMQYGTANADAINAFKKNGSKLQVIIFFGTWCEDSQNLVPVFLRLADKSGFPPENISLIAVDRAKQTLGNLHKAFNIVSVPTFIVMKEGKEIGRVVEYGKYGEIDKELGEIAAAVQ